MKFRPASKPELPGFQVMPMIDIVFNLLFFFLVSQIFAQWETEITVKVPTAQTGSPIDRLPGEVIINITREGTVIINKQTLNDQELGSVLTKIKTLFPGQPVLIRADKGTPYGHVIKVLDLCRQVEIWNISFATSVSEES